MHVLDELRSEFGWPAPDDEFYDACRVTTAPAPA
jgi:hypothetical protein